MSQMFITPIVPMEPLGSIGNEKKVTAGRDGSPDFRDIFKEAIQSVKSTDENLMVQEYLLSTGQIDDPHTVPAAAAQAQLSVEFLASLRTKALEAYNEIIRIGI
ncbi:MAG: flagellar hook-basal body complex protein FliE [Lacrimispora sp.]|uniref:flagellar hook-basal body complex protein FliE n=1 Tax=Lacrimispora sp. TaxID=2719234 RepID=UPI0039E2B8F0